MFETSITATALLSAFATSSVPPSGESASELGVPVRGASGNKLTEICSRALDVKVLYTQTVPALPQAPSAYMRRFTYDTIGHTAAVMKFLISEVGADRIMLGSDYCLDMGYLRPVQDLDALNLPARERDMILRGTAARLLKV